MYTTSAMPPKKSSNLRRRPETPNLNVAQFQAQVQTQDEPLTADPNSPPETPTTSPPFSRKTSLKPRRQPDFHDYFQPLDSDPNIRPVGDGHQFSYRPSLGPEQLSPRSSSSSGMADDDSSDEDSSSENGDESASPSIRSMGNATGPAVSSPIDDSDVDLDKDTDSSSDSDTSESDSDAESEKSETIDEAEASHITIATTAAIAHNFTLEDVDPMDSDCDGLDVLQPTEIESNRSRSRSRSRHRKEHKTMVKDFRNLNCTLYENLDFGVDMDSRTALVGPNGVGKSTLLNIFTGKLQPTTGVVSRHTHLKLGVYSQHSAEQLDLTKSSLDFVRDKFAHISQDYQYWRQQLGRFGMTGEGQTSKMATLSDGQKSRIVFALLAIEGPNMLLLDEPTNGLDIPTIDSLADAINAFSGGVVVVSHDFRLLDKIAKDIMVCEHKTVRRWDGSIGEYKNHLRKKMSSTGAL
jgi:ABC-type Mn2+/Zn2+ transport system ATPase subunit